MHRPLRFVLALDSAILFLLGTLFCVAPKQIEAAFGFTALPEGVSYIIGLWGCVFVTMAFGYWVAAGDPLRHLTWVQVGIARGAMEAVFGFVSIARGIASVRQAWPGIAVAALITIAYLILYPRKEAAR